MVFLGRGVRCNIFLQRRMRLEVVDELVEIVGPSPYFASKYLALFLNCWTNIIVGRLKEFGYKNIWSPWIQRNISPNIVSKAANFLNTKSEEAMK